MYNYSISWHEFLGLIKFAVFCLPAPVGFCFLPNLGNFLLLLFRIFFQSFPFPLLLKFYYTNGSFVVPLDPEALISFLFLSLFSVFRVGELYFSVPNSLIFILYYLHFNKNFLRFLQLLYIFHIYTSHLFFSISLFLC